MQQILLVLLFVVISYLLGSWLVPTPWLYFFDVLWRLLVISGIIYWSNVSFGLTAKQWLATLLVFLIGFMVSRLVFPATSPWIHFISIVMAPLSEELLFRGWIIQQIKGRDRNKIVISSVLFGLYHIKNILITTPTAQVYQVFYTTLIVGPVFAWLRLRYNSLFPSIALHGINNIWAETLTRKLFPFIVRAKN